MIIQGVKIIQIVACFNYDVFQHLIFIFFTKKSFNYLKNDLNDEIHPKLKVYKSQTEIKKKKKKKKKPLET
jgi:hypothetical protein